MKKLIVYSLVLSLAIISCSKSKSVPDPSASLTFGSLTFGTIIKFIPFKSQDTILPNQLDTIKFMGVEISENHLDSTYFLETRKPSFILDISTNMDKEHFISGSNCYLGGWGGGKGIGGIDCSLDGEIDFPIRISQNPIPNNDTLEFTGEKDHILISYLSKYSKLLVVDSLIINKK